MIINKLSIVPRTKWLTLKSIYKDLKLLNSIKDVKMIKWWCYEKKLIDWQRVIIRFYLFHKKKEKIIYKTHQRRRKDFVSQPNKVSEVVLDGNHRSYLREWGIYLILMLIYYRKKGKWLVFYYCSRQGLWPLWLRIIIVKWRFRAL